ncbi:MAG: nucleotidyltransferase domain-containing protein [Saprospiraceae bacterium]
MRKKEQILKMIKMVVDKNAPDSEVSAYGSHARGNAKKLSDWDLLILLNLHDVSFEFETKFMDEFYELELKTERDFSPLIYSKIEWNSKYSITPLYENIQQKESG